MDKIVLFGSLKWSAIKGKQKQHVWKEITTAANSIGVDNQSPADVEICNFYICNI